ncbi:SIR2 family protein [Flavobacterium sp. M31R6]|uniref:SIR2 family protein n=1 Tax=Flavobacterium sp. M31R6 TaxID=2739062 RepID=UPI0015696CCF|nr:SIR2 family protein [Flavobacterium sp. M31R6]QKJ61739.1 SIR2 family protein [Flavobacterium sp. M31R6]
MKHFFYKGSQDTLLKESDFEKIKENIKKDLSKILDTRNLSFLIGSGCSLGKNGIPTMKQLADNLFEPKADLNENLKDKVFEAKHIEILEKFKINYKNEPFRSNLETFLGTLYSYRFYLEKLQEAEEMAFDTDLKDLNLIIERTKDYILYECLNEKNKGNDGNIVDVYQQFYRKLSLRDSNLQKPNVFTTNYDLFSERAMDNLGISYTNGFSGFVERFFNPSIFNYALAEQMDISSLKWSVIDSFIYLFKIHGSVNWVEKESNNKLFSIQELQDVNYAKLKTEANYMIYPSPLKQNASLGSPYADLFREFQKRITQKQSTLVTMGFSFGDEHINNIIYQALTIPSFRLVIFSDIGNHVDGKYEASRKNIEKLKDLNDPRIWIIGTDAEYDGLLQEGKIIEKDHKELHFFDTIANDLFPDFTQDDIDEANKKLIELIRTKGKGND